MKSNYEIENGFAALKAETSDPSAADRALQSLRNPRSSLNWRLATLPIAGLALLAAFLATPRSASAAELREILETLRNSKVWANTQFVPDKQNGEVVSMQIASNGAVQKVTFNPLAAAANSGQPKALALSEGRRITFRSDCTVIDDVNDVWFKQAPETIIDDLLKNQLVTRITTKKGLDVGGRKLDEYVVNWKQGLERSGEIALYTEAGTKRPVKMLGVGGNSVGLHSEWRYEDVPKDLLDVSIPADLPCYDIASQRNEFESQVVYAGSKGEPRVVGVWADHSGNVVVMTTGDAGLMATAKNGVSISGLGPGEFSGFAWNLVATKGNVPWCVPTSFLSVPTVAHTIRFKEAIPDEVSVKVQVWREFDPKASSVLSWQGHVNRTYSLTALFAPETRPYYLSDASRPEARK